MSLAGLPTMLSPAAVTYHRLHGTAAGWGHTLRLRLYERNALFAVIKNFGDEAAARVVPAAIALTLARALATEGLDRDAVRFGKTAPEQLPLPPTVVATLLALEDVARALPRLAEKRAAVQASRRVSDQDLFQLFPEPLKLHDVGGAYREAAEALIRDLGIDALFGLAPSRTEARPERRDVAEERTERRDFDDDGTERRDFSPGEDGDHPTVSVVVLTASGATHLPACLDSLRAHTWPAARTEVIVVDNGSADDPTAWPNATTLASASSALAPTWASRVATMPAPASPPATGWCS
jgi:hypothetical protein